MANCTQLTRTLGALLVGLSCASPRAEAQSAPPPPADAPQAAPAPESATPPPGRYPVAEQAPPAARYPAPAVAYPAPVAAYPVPSAPPAPEGQWLQTAEYGWVWIPAGAISQPVQGIPSAYLYTPSYGWTWYAAPWGAGAYRHGGWAGHRGPFAPRIWVHGHRGWGWHARPHVVIGWGPSPYPRHGGWGRGWGHGRHHGGRRHHAFR